VPIDWSRPAGDGIEVAVARRKATGPGTRIGTLVIMPGGPGNSGVGNLMGPLQVTPEIAARFDLVSFDPRGTNRSHPIVCDAELVGSILTDTTPDAGRTLADVTAFSRRLGDSCREHSGPLIDHIDSVSTARDIDALRAALGEETISLFGRSYGTLTGQLYAETFPTRVRALVLDSVMEHSKGIDWFVTSGARTGEDSFTEFAQWCAGDSACSLHGRDVAQVYDDLYARAVDGQLHQPGDPAALISPMELNMAVVDPLYGPRWTEAADLLRDLSQRTRSAPAPSAAHTGAEVEEFPWALFCADYRVDISSEREWTALYRRQNRAAPHLRTHFTWQIMSLCTGWTAAVGNPQHRPRVRATAPILLLNSLHDPSTSYEWATAVDRDLRGGVLLTYDGWGHGVLDRSDCTRTAALRYLVDLTTPRRGTHCPAVPPDPEADADADADARVAAERKPSAFA
jgi:pimeloyl-ACP methyl ester carboxylesterase